MHPFLFQWGPLAVRTYGALVAVAFLVGLRLARYTTARRQIPEAFLLDLTMIIVVSGIVGARLLFVLLNAAYFREHPFQSLFVWRGGLVFYGGFLLAAGAALWFARRHHVSSGVVADCLAPALAFGQAIGRWGCFFAGCCYGRPSDLPWAVTYRDAASLAPLDVALHPTQIYESMGDAAIGLLLLWILARRRHSHGEVFWIYVFLYATLRLLIEFVRGDDRGPALGGLYPSQLIAIAAMLVSGSILLTHLATTDDAHATH